MNVKIKKCMAVLGVLAVVGMYAVGAYRIEMARQAPKVAACSFGHCVPTSATLSALR
ncbi:MULTISPECIES: hypothetical protein [Pseudomonas]|uniref:Uncharacterized protein n=1 Tax=Pseudomonas cichorii TaxID=36746 RepID=A0A3M4W4H7_PSECI|nr:MULTISPECIES: hypothetical protein [Pseudomonas]AHF69265.1 hypothetical protein PCH70_41120 [Pseudomonas cichorii JBC1]MBX8484588.1 hypothetical protein [Pseudomonas cichorii]MBX8494541.1 hypothetical protein [Pseudomonas cichorii]MBX8514445.1 hypothetical protein [Pseudomonas cichorii]MBX8529792.1 hypothetical protein [Pseudomonas cichorii]